MLIAQSCSAFIAREAAGLKHDAAKMTGSRRGQIMLTFTFIEKLSPYGQLFARAAAFGCNSEALRAHFCVFLAEKISGG